MLDSMKPEWFDRVYISSQYHRYGKIKRGLICCSDWGYRTMPPGGWGLQGDMVWQIGQPYLFILFRAFLTLDDI